MAQVYGRLDVFFPDGLLKTVLLSEGAVSIGRSPGNTIALESDTISRYHLSITRQGGETFITDLDSQNGTFIDGARLASNQPRAITGGEEVQIGELRLIFLDLDENPTRPIEIAADTLASTAQIEPHLTASIQGPEIAVPPGSHTSACLTITNTGEARERYLIDVTGVPRPWVRIDRPQLELEPGASADVTINFKPARRFDTTPGTYPVQVTVAPRNRPAEASLLTVELRVLAFGAFALQLEPAEAGGAHVLGDDGRFRVHVHNQGSAPLPLRVRVQQAEKTPTLDVRLEPAALTLAPGQRASLMGQARPVRRPFTGTPSIETFDVIAQAGTAARYLVAARAAYTLAPVLPKWAPLALVGAAVPLAIVLVLAVLALFQPARVPVITRFALTPLTRDPGGNVLVEWTVEDAERVVVFSGTDPAGPSLTGLMNPDAGSTVLTLPAGRFLLTLRAERGRAAAQASAEIVVAAPLPSASAVLSPSVPVRYVVQTVQLSWEAPGASAVRVENLESLSTAPLLSTYAPTDSITFSILPVEAAYTFTLVVVAGDGGETRQPFTLTTVEPSCEAAAETPLREAPNPDAQTISTIAQPVAVFVDARDISGAWVRVQGRGWGPATAFTCVGFNPADLRVELTGSPPTPGSPAPAPTADGATAAAPVPGLAAPVLAAPAVNATPTFSLFTGVPVFAPTAQPPATLGP
jgi:hypothetical protein